MKLSWFIRLHIVTTAAAHLFVGSPPPFQWSIDIDRLIMPMNGDPNHQGPGWKQQPFPCKGLHSALVKPQVTWRAGDEVTLQLFDSTNTTGATMHDPGAAHSGGSCQVSLSYDNGQTWTVVQSWEGNCPRVRKGQEGQVTNSYEKNQDYSFRLPGDLPSADVVIVAWTWLNATGNREFYMSCFPIRLESSRNSTNRTLGHPMLIANLKADPNIPDTQDWAWKRCHTPASVWIQYPERNRGINEPIRAASPVNGQIKFADFGDTEGFCGSDNTDLLRALV